MRSAAGPLASASRPCEPREVAGILDRLGSSAEFWEQRLKKLFSRSRLLGSYFATDRERLRLLAARRGVHHLGNLFAVPAVDS
jgi:hypothetical protein